MPVTFRCCESLCWFELLDNQDDNPCWGLVLSICDDEGQDVHVCEGHEAQYFGGAYTAELSMDPLETLKGRG